MKMAELSKDGVKNSIGKTNQRISLFESGLLSLIGYSLINSMYPPYELYANTLLCVGIGSIAWHFKGRNKFEKLFQKCNLFKDDMYPQLKKKKSTAYGYCLRFSLPLGMSTDDFSKKKKAIEQYMDRRIEIKYVHKNVLIEVYEKELENEYPYQVVKTKGNIEFPVGYTYGGKIITAILENEPHMLIAGETGSGKSTVLRGIITYLILEKKVKLHLIDLKQGAEFNIFKKSNRVKTFSKNRSEAEGTLLKLSREVEKRYNLFAENNVPDIKSYNELGKGKLGYEVVIIDEYADLQNEKGSIAILEELAAKARACGIHMIISTQRPDANVLNGRIKANIPITLGLKTRNEINSRIILDHGGLEGLKGKGHGIFKQGKETEIQAMNLSTKEAIELIKHTYVKKKERIKPKTNGEVKSFEFMEGIK